MPNGSAEAKIRVGKDLGELNFDLSKDDFYKLPENHFLN